MVDVNVVKCHVLNFLFVIRAMIKGTSYKHLFAACATSHYRSTIAEIIGNEGYWFVVYFNSCNTSSEWNIVSWLVVYNQKLYK